MRDLLSPDSELRSSSLNFPAASFQTVGSEEDLPAKLNISFGAAFLVPSFALAEKLIERGATSGRIAIDLDNDSAPWLEALQAAGPEAALLPPKAFSFPFKSLLILPTYNERENLARMLPAVRAWLCCDILIVDDNSPDGTGQIADELADEYEALFVMHRAGKQGLGKAYIAGFLWALGRDYERVFQMDCDFSHAPWDLPRLAHAALTADLVIGSRYVRGGKTEGWALRRRLLSSGANLYTKLILSFAIKDWTAGFRCYKTELLRKIDLSKVAANGYSFQIEMAWRSKKQGAKICEVPIRFIDREDGVSKMDSKIAMEAVRLVPWLRMRI